MIKKLLKWLAVLVMCSLLMALLVWTGRGAWRNYQVGRIVNASSYAQARVAVMPAKKKLDVTRGGAVNMGYAKFDAGKSSDALSVKVSGSKGTGVTVTRGNYLVEFDSPSPPQVMDATTRAEVERSTELYPRVAAYILEMSSDPVGANLEMEGARPVPFFSLCGMNTDEFLLYCRKLQEKVSKEGIDEVYGFETTHAKGLVRIGKEKGDRQKGHILLSSRDGWKTVGCDVSVKEGSEGDAGEMLEQIAGTFEFTLDNLGDEGEIRRVITEAGVK